MKTLYLECNMGAAGDMLTAALLEICENPDEIQEKINALGLPGVRMEAETLTRSGIRGTHVSVKIDGEIESANAHEFRHKHEHEKPEHMKEHEHVHEHIHDHEGHAREHDHHAHHSHSSMADITEKINAFPLSDKVKRDVLAVYRIIAEAESAVHGKPVAQVHFHEVGELDAIADITAVCLLMEQLAAERVVVSPVHTGSGFVRCAHGLLPVPAPATELILRGIPNYGGGIKGELCTPTGAALLRYFATEFGDKPVMRVTKTGYGMGTKEFAAVNCVRAFWGETAEGTAANEIIAELTCNLDDMTGEALGYATDLLFREGALDVYTSPIQMKKNRPGVLLTCLCEAEKANHFAQLILRHTTTLGLRKKICEKFMLKREFETLKTPWGDIRIKKSSGYGTSKSKAEYEDVVKIAEKSGLSYEEILALAKK